MKYLKALLVLVVTLLTFGSAMAQTSHHHYNHRHWHHRHWHHHHHQ